MAVAAPGVVAVLRHLVAALVGVIEAKTELESFRKILIIIWLVRGNYGSLSCDRSSGEEHGSGRDNSRRPF